MNVRRRRAVARAWRWLARAPVASSDVERQLQRLFALASAGVLEKANGSANRCFRRLATKLASFDYSEFSGDPITAVAVRAAFSSRGIEHNSLYTLTSAYAEGLRENHTSLDPEMTLLAVLCNKFDDLQISQKYPTAFAVGHEVTDFTRADLTELCRKLFLVTACGSYPIELETLRVILPCLSVSCARDRDLELVSRTLRACAFLKLDYGDACVWSAEWLLDQQHTDGRFGLLAPEAHQAGRDPMDYRLYFELTVGVLWTLAELEKPGFMLGSEF